MVVIETAPLPAAGEADADEGDSEIEQTRPVCCTVNVRPAIVNAPARSPSVGLEATLNPTDPTPEPAAPLVTTIHGTLDTDVQEQLPLVMTLTVRAPPAGPTEALSALSAKLQEGAS